MMTTPLTRSFLQPCLSRCVAALVLFVLACIHPLHGQILYGSIVGNVTDSSGAVVPAAVVKITHAQTNQSRETTTNEVGSFSFPTVGTGSYTVVFSKEGFKTYAEREVFVSLNGAIRVNAALVPGSLSESVQVSAKSEALQADRAEVRSEINTAALENLPAFGRNYQNLFTTLPGISPPTDTVSSVNNPTKALRFTSNGTGSSTVNVRIEGVGASNLWFQFLSVYVPAQDAIETVNVVSNSFSAEQGLAGGAAVNVQLKSGTNSIHGSIFEYNQNNALKANPFFLPAGQNKPKLVYNQFGGTIGGPIKRDKLFYFVSYEGLTDRKTAARILTVPTDAIRSGNLAGSSSPIYDPLTGNPDGTGRNAFAGNLIPADRINPSVKKLIALIPEPTSPNLLTNNIYVSHAYAFTSHKIDGKINWNPTTKLTITGRVSDLPFNVNNPPVFGNTLVGNATFSGEPGTDHGSVFSTTMGGTYVFKPNLILDAYFGFSRQHTNYTPPGLDVKYGTDILGIPGTNGPDPKQGGLPQFGVTNYSLIGYQTGPLEYLDPQYQSVANMSWVKGVHNIRFGLDFAKLDINHYETTIPGFSFTGGITSLNGGPSPNQFNSYADFLLGMPFAEANGELTSKFSTMRTWETNLYIQDQWQVNKRLTVNYGVRWEYFPVPVRADRGMERFDFNTNQQLVCGVGSVPRDCGVQVSHKLFAPLAGIAFRPTDTFVIRAGYGLNWLQFDMGQTVLNNFPEAVTYSLSGPNSFQPASLLSNGLPPIQVPDYSSGRVPLPFGSGELTWPQNYVRGYVQSWNFTLQKQFAGGWVAQAGYVATRTVHQQERVNINYGQIGGGRNSQPFWNNLGISGTFVLLEPLQHMRYDSLQTKLERRFANGFQVGAAYTWSKWLGLCCDDTAEGSPAIPIPQYWNRIHTVMPSDRTHNFSFTGIAELPFGPGKPMLTHGFVSQLAGGWQVNAVLSAYTGLPFTVTASNTSLNAPGSNQIADQVTQHVQILNKVGEYLDPTAFAPVTTARFGNAGINSLRGPGFFNTDLGLFRGFRLGERWRAQIRAEAYNLTNTPHFSLPAANISNVQFNPDRTVKSLNGFGQITSTTGSGREGLDERVIKLGLRLTF